jgi:putative transposase
VLFGRWDGCDESGSAATFATLLGRRECLDHVIVFNEAGLVQLMTFYCSYYEQSRTHLSLDKDAPIPRPVTPARDGTAVVAIPEVGGLHHRYERRAA